MPKVLFETPRVFVREWSAQDVEDCFLLAANPLVMKCIADPMKSREQAVKSIERRNRHYASQGYGNPLHVASKGLLQKCGMTFESVIDSHKEVCELYSKSKAA